MTIRILRFLASISASPTASATMSATRAGWRFGSLRFTNSRIRLTIIPARSACCAVFSSAGASISLVARPLLTIASVPEQ